MAEKLLQAEVGVAEAGGERGIVCRPSVRGGVCEHSEQIPERGDCSKGWKNIHFLALILLYLPSE